MTEHLLQGTVCLLLQIDPCSPCCVCQRRAPLSCRSLRRHPATQVPCATDGLYARKRGGELGSLQALCILDGCTMW